MRKIILIAGFVLASAAAQAADRGLSLAGSETATLAAPAQAVERLKTAEAPQAAEVARPEAPKYVERPAVIEPKTEATKTEAKVEQPAAKPAKPIARKRASSSKSQKPRRTRYWTEARIIRELNRHGIYW